MNLQCRTELILSYRAGSQIARILSEEWCSREVYCPACPSDRLAATKVNNPAIDFTCPACNQPFQLKSQKGWNGRKIVDAGYDAMLRAIRADRTPNLLVMQYSSDWSIQNLLLIPRAFFTEAVIEKRRPLRASARRAGWVGCNILLNRIAEDGKIAMISSGVPVPEQTVRREFSRIRGLSELSPSIRGWTVDVLNLIRRLGKNKFSLQELYHFEPEFKSAHPRNENIRPKIRQQLQILRDMGILEFVEPGKYSLRY